MVEPSRHDAWNAGQNYDYYMGRWSRAIAREYLLWLDMPANLDWLDVGCGTGALSAAIVERCEPRSVLGVDPADGFIAHAHQQIVDDRVQFQVGDAQALPCADRCVDVVASALAYNFVPDRPKALAEMCRVLRPGGTASFYVWDYPGGGMGFIDAFWKAAVALNPDAAPLDEGSRFPFCTLETLRREAVSAGLDDVQAQAVEVTTQFEDFDAFWHPFTLGAGPAPGYCIALDESARTALKATLRERLATAKPIALPARAWAIRGVVR